MKKAKNVFAIIAIVFGVVAAALLMLHPVLDGLLVKMTEGASTPMAYGDYFNVVIERVKNIFDFGWITSFNLEALKVHYALVVGVVGIVLLIVLLIIMLCKKHAKGLGWWFVLLVVVLLGTVVASVYSSPNYFMDVEVQSNVFICNVVESKYFGLAGLILAVAAVGLVILASIFYIVYVCKARSNEKKVDSAREAAIAKIDALLGGNK